jgi:hypothetical protein
LTEPMDPEKSGAQPGGAGNVINPTEMSKTSSHEEQTISPGKPPSTSGGASGSDEPVSKRMKVGTEEGEESEENWRNEGEGDDSDDDEEEGSQALKSDEDMEDGEVKGDKSAEEEDEIEEFDVVDVDDDNGRGKEEKDEEKGMLQDDVLDDVILKSLAYFHGVEVCLQEDFTANKRKAEYQDGFLVGGLIFSGWMPTYEAIADGLRAIGISDNDLSPISNTSTLKLLVEIRVTKQDRVEPIGYMIRRNAQMLADTLKRSFKWRDLRWVDHWTVVLKGIPVNWGEEEIKGVLLSSGRFPYRNLAAIGRPATDLKGKVGGSTLLLRYTSIPISLLGLHLADPTRLQVKVSKRKVLSWSFGAHPWGYDEAHKCTFCMTVHPDRLDCPLEEIVEKNTWTAVTATLEMENMTLDGDTDEVQKIQYRVEKNYNMDVVHEPVRRYPYSGQQTPVPGFTGMSSSSMASSTAPSAGATVPPPPAPPHSGNPSATASPNPPSPTLNVVPSAFLTKEVPLTPYSTPGQQHKVHRKGAWNFPHDQDENGGRGRGGWRGRGK